LGFINDLRNRVKTLNSEFNYCGRIVILADIYCIKNEIRAHSTLLEYRSYHKIKGVNKKEVYKSYNMVIGIIASFKNRLLFESPVYRIEPNNTEYFQGNLLDPDIMGEQMHHRRIHR